MKRTGQHANGNRLTQTVTRTKADNTTVTETTSYTYDAENRLTKTTFADGSFVETSHNSLGKTATTKDQLGRVTSFTYEARGNLTRTDYPDSTFETTAYDLENRVTSTTDRLGHTTATTYDTLGRATLVTVADGSFTQTAYDAAGRVTSTTDALGHVTTFGYDNAGRRTSVTDALNQITTSVFDAAGNVTSITDALNHTTGYTYDNRGQRTTVTFPDGTTQLTTFDTLGRRVATTDQEGKITRYRFDGLGRLVEVRQYLDSATAASDSDYSLPATHSSLLLTSYSYDELGNQITQTDALDRITRYAYDSLGRRVKRTLPDGAFETYAYNAVGSLTSKTDFAGRTTTFAYDAQNRLTSKTASSSHPSLIYSHAIAKIEYDYDANGARIAARTYNSSNTQLYSETTPRDVMGRLDMKLTALGGLSYTYNTNGQLLDVVSSNEGGVNAVYEYKVKIPGASSGAFDKTSANPFEPHAIHPQIRSTDQAGASSGVSDPLRMNPRANHSGRSAMCQLRGHSRIIVTGQLLGYRTFTDRRNFHLHLTEHPSDLPSTCHVPWSTGGAPVASFINDGPDQN